MASHSRESLGRRFAADKRSIHYVYLIRDDAGNPVYVGMGRNGRADESARIHGGTAEVMVSDLTRDEALDTERRIIAILGRRGVDPFGVLANAEALKPRRERPESLIAWWANETLSPSFVEIDCFWCGSKRDVRYYPAVEHKPTGERIRVHGPRSSNKDRASQTAYWVMKRPDRCLQVYLFVRFGLMTPKGGLPTA